MNPRSFLEVADDLLGGMTEAAWRSAVSRAYYAAFHVGRELLQKWGFAVPQAEQAHAFVWRRLANAGHPVVQNAGQVLHSVRSERNRADYELDFSLSDQRAAAKVQQAADVIRVLDGISASPQVESQLIDAVRAYERDVLREVTWTDRGGAAP